MLLLKQLSKITGIRMSKTKRSAYSPFKSFRLHFYWLEGTAYFKIVSRDVSPIYKRFHYICRVLILLMVFIYNLQHLIKVVQVRHSTLQMINVVFLLLTTLNTAAKQLSFNMRSGRIDHIIDVLDGPYFSSSNPCNVSVLKRNGRIMSYIFWVYMSCVICTGSMWGVFPIVNRLLGQQVEFNAYFPYDYNESPWFELSAIYLSVTLTLQGVAHVAMDCTIVALLAQARAQLQILRYNLEHLTDVEHDLDEAVNKSRAKLATSTVHQRSYSYPQDKDILKAFQRRLVQCVTHYKKIKWFVKETESIFAGALAFQVSVVAWVICMTVYKLVNTDLLLLELMVMALYLFCMLAQFFIYCYHGTQVQYESMFVSQSVYFCQWDQLPPSFRRLLLIMMQNCQPIQPKTASIIPISLSTYISALRASYTLFTFLDRK